MNIRDVHTNTYMFTLTFGSCSCVYLYMYNMTVGFIFNRPHSLMGQRTDFIVKWNSILYESGHAHALETLRHPISRFNE